MGRLWEGYATGPSNMIEKGPGRLYSSSKLEGGKDGRYKEK